MNLLVKRNKFNGGSTLGDLLIDGAWFCFTLEPTMREIPGLPVEKWKITGVTALPVGTYPITMRLSPKFGRVLPHIENTPGFSETMLHPLNKPSETEGCIGVGYECGAACIMESRQASDALNQKIQTAIDSGEDVTITITNQPKRIL